MILRLERCGMKFAHIGDLHIGKRVHDFSMLEDQRYILDQMMKIFATYEYIKSLLSTPQ